MGFWATPHLCEGRLQFWPEIRRSEGGLQHRPPAHPQAPVLGARWFPALRPDTLRLSSECLPESSLNQTSGVSATEDPI